MFRLQLITFLLDLLRERRCLLVLDNVETILRAGEFAGRYREGYEGYGRLIGGLAETVHQSCLLLTSREMPSNLEFLLGTHSSVRAFRVFGLGVAASQELLKDKVLFGTPQDWNALILKRTGEEHMETPVGDGTLLWEPSEVGELVLTEPLPSMPLYFWNDPGNTRYQESYFDSPSSILSTLPQRSVRRAGES
jgi:hypothetical protein